MTIRGKLTVLFTIIVASVLLLVFYLIFLISNNYRESEFEGRLEEKADQTATLYLEVDEVDSTLLSKIDYRTKGTLIEERVTIFDQNGRVLYSSDLSNKMEISLKEINLLKKDEKLKFDRGNIEVVGLIKEFNNQPYYIFVGGFDKFGKRKIVNLRNTLIVTWIISVIIMTIAGWFYSGRVLNPVSNMIREVDAIDDTRLNERIGVGNGKDELARLAETFNNLLSRLESSIESEKKFLSNASHELRNPLASITAQLEVCLLNDRTTDSYKATLNSVLDDIIGLNKLTHQLLMLTRIDSGVSIENISDTTVDQILFEAIESSKISSDLTIDFNFTEKEFDESKHRISCVKELLISAFQNIIENSSKFGSTILKISHYYQDGYHVISFSDNGFGIEIEDQNKVFDSFYRASVNQKIEGHGVGLALVHKIIMLHQGKIFLESEMNAGTVFTFHIPASFGVGRID